MSEEKLLIVLNGPRTALPPSSAFYSTELVTEKVKNYYGFKRNSKPMENITTDVCSDFTANVLLDAQLKNVIKSDSDLRHGVRFGG